MSSSSSPHGPTMASDSSRTIQSNVHGALNDMLSREMNDGGDSSANARASGSVAAPLSSSALSSSPNVVSQSSKSAAAVEARDQTIEEILKTRGNLRRNVSDDGGSSADARASGSVAAAPNPQGTEFVSAKTPAANRRVGPSPGQGAQCAPAVAEDGRVQHQLDSPVSVDASLSRENHALQYRLEQVEADPRLDEEQQTCFEDKVSFNDKLECKVRALEAKLEAAQEEVARRTDEAAEAEKMLAEAENVVHKLQTELDASKAALEEHQSRPAKQVELFQKTIRELRERAAQDNQARQGKKEPLI